MSFRRGQLDVYIPVMALLACIALPLWLGSTFQTWRAIPSARAVEGRVTAINDRPPYADKTDRYGLEYPVVRYIDHEGFERHLMPYSGALPGHFRMGQVVSVGRIDRQYVLLDRWYIWQEHIVIVPLFGIWILAAFGYYRFWRPRMIGKEKSNKPVQRNAGSRPFSNDPPPSDIPSSLGPRG